MDGKKLVRMANDIAAFFRAEPVRADAIAGVVGHLRKFWDPRMRRELLALHDAGGEGMDELVKEALQSHRDGFVPAG
ncbi:MAG: formate dehydrogenase subunit delta [Planctomycetes bacterium]|nr:formate dehydrogenase subunit delta [Planctomycetota bacterium]